MDPETRIVKVGEVQGVFEPDSFMRWQTYRALYFREFWTQMITDTLYDDISEIDTLALLFGLGHLFFQGQHPISMACIANWFVIALLKMGVAEKVGPVIAMMARALPITWGFYFVLLALRVPDIHQALTPGDALMCVNTALTFLYHALHTVSCLHRCSAVYWDVVAWRIHIVNTAFKFLEVYTLLPVVGYLVFSLINADTRAQNSSPLLSLVCVFVLYGIERVIYVWVSASTSHRALLLQVLVNGACLGYVLYHLHHYSEHASLYQFLLLVVANLVQDVLFYVGTHGAGTHSLLMYSDLEGRGARVFRREPNYVLLSPPAYADVFCLRVAEREVLVERLSPTLTGELHIEPAPLPDLNKVSIGSHTKLYHAMDSGIVGVYETFEEANSAAGFYLLAINGPREKDVLTQDEEHVDDAGCSSEMD